MKQVFKLELILYISNSRLFSSFCKNVKITLEKIKIKYLIFIIETKNYNFILG